MIISPGMTLLAVGVASGILLYIGFRSSPFLEDWKRRNNCQSENKVKDELSTLLEKIFLRFPISNMLIYVSTMISALLIESDKVVPGQEKYNMATFMVLFLLITIEVVVVKVVISDMEQDEDSHTPLRAAAVFFDRED